MAVFELVTAGESHGPCLTGILRGVPSGLRLEREAIDAQLARRQAGYGRSPRQQIEQDRIEVTAGLRHGVTLGSPIAFVLANADHASWDAVMHPWAASGKQGNWRDRDIHVPRPGHADLAGIARGAFGEGLRPVLERASARETAARVAAGAIAQQLLAVLGVRVRAHVVQVGAVVTDVTDAPGEDDARWSELDSRQLRALDAELDTRMAGEVEQARAERDTLGGVVEVVAWGLPPGIGGYATSEERLDGRLARAACAVHAIKAVAIGAGDGAGSRRGSQQHDELYPLDEAARTALAGALGGDQGMGVTRRTNRAGGIEGGMCNGAPLVVRATMKPLPTLMRPLATVDLASGEPATAHAERSDTCAIAAAAVVLEAAIALELARVVREQFGAQALVDVLDAWRSYCLRVLYPERAPITLA